MGATQCMYARNLGPVARRFNGVLVEPGREIQVPQDVTPEQLAWWSRHGWEIREQETEMEVALIPNPFVTMDVGGGDESVATGGDPLPTGYSQPMRPSRRVVVRQKKK